MAASARAALLVLLAVALPMTARADPVAFRTQTVDSIGDRGVHSSLALDSGGMPHISYYGDNQLLYASMRDSTWSIERVDSDVGFYSSLAIDRNDVPHICYFDSVRADVRYATKLPGYWVTELVDSTGSVGKYATIALDPQGRPGIAYFDDTNGDLKYATKVNGAWSVEIADSAGIVGYYTSIAFDGLGQPCISYLDLEGGLKFARRTAGGWQPVMVEQGVNVGAFSSLALDTLGFAHISYADMGAQSLKFADETSLGWYTQTVDPSDFAGPYTSLRLDAEMNPHVSYIAQRTKRLQYAVRRGTLWEFQSVDLTTGVTHFNSLALDAHGNPMISYYDEFRQNLRFADASVHLIEPRGGEFWPAGSTQNVVWIGSGYVDVYLSPDDGQSYVKVTRSLSPYSVIPILVPAWNSGTVRAEVVRDTALAVSATRGTLTVGQGLSTPWWTRLVDGAGLTGFSPSLKLTPLESPRIAYWDATDRAVKYASRSGGVWSVETLASGLASTTQTPLQITSNGIPEVAFFDNTDLWLVWGERQNGVWSYEIAARPQASGDQCSMAIDRYGMPRVAYYDRVPGRLVLAARLGVTWGAETVETGDSLGLFNSVAIDTAGEPYVSYWDGRNRDLKFASKAGAVWTIEVVDAVGDVGRYTSLALDAQQNPHVSYVDVTNGNLKYATKQGGVWTIETVDAGGRVGNATSIAIDAAGVPHIAYHDRVGHRLRVASRAGGFWTLETVVPATAAGTTCSLALGRDGNERIAYLEDIQNDLRYASSAIELGELVPGVPWPLASHRTILWDGNGPVNLSLSRDRGVTYDPIASGVSGGSYAWLVSGPSAVHCVVRAERLFPPSVSTSDTFAILSGVNLISFRAAQAPFGSGADVTWQTDPAVPDIQGYRLERAVNGGAYALLVGPTTATSYHDDRAAAGTTYRLTAIDGFGGLFVLGETGFTPRKPLAAGPTPLRGGSMTIAFATVGRTELRVYDIRGRLVRTIADGAYPAGFQTVTWDGKDGRGRPVASGLYVLKTVSGGHEASLKISVLR